MCSHLRRFSICALMTLLCIGSSFGADLESAKRAYHQRDYPTAVKEFTTLAQQGNSDAQLILGKMYMLGQAVPKDPDQATKWFRAAADQGDADAQFFLGSVYLLPQTDVAEGLKWMRLSADQGMPDAQFLLGMAYLQGKGLPRDLIQADMWLRLAVAQEKDLEFYRTQRDAAERQMTADQIAQATALAAAWKPKDKSSSPHTGGTEVNR
jgi:TPR repeat protein